MLNKQQATQLHSTQSLLGHDLPATSSSSSGSASIRLEKSRVNLMLSKSIACLNQLLRLVLQRELSATYLSKSQAKNHGSTKDQRGLKLYYIDQLPCVHEMRQLLCKPQQSR
jgi:hypothetical protein